MAKIKKKCPKDILQQFVEDFGMPMYFGLVPWGHHIGIITNSNSIPKHYSISYRRLQMRRVALNSKDLYKTAQNRAVYLLFLTKIFVEIHIPDINFALGNKSNAHIKSSSSCFAFLTVARGPHAPTPRRAHEARKEIYDILPPLSMH